MEVEGAPSGRAGVGFVLKPEGRLESPGSGNSFSLGSLSLSFRPLDLSRTSSSLSSLSFSLVFSFSFSLSFLEPFLSVAFAPLRSSNASAAFCLSASFLASNNWFLSAFFFSIHQSALAASQASVNTECTIWPVSNPIRLSVLRRFRSRSVENANGALTVICAEKSGSFVLPRGAIGGGDTVGEPGGELVRLDETERRFVRTGVRDGKEEGGREEEDPRDLTKRSCS